MPSRESKFETPNETGRNIQLVPEAAESVAPTEPEPTWEEKKRAWRVAVEKGKAAAAEREPNPNQ